MSIRLQASDCQSLVTVTRGEASPLLVLLLLIIEWPRHRHHSTYRGLPFCCNDGGVQLVLLFVKAIYICVVPLTRVVLSHRS